MKKEYFDLPSLIEMIDGPNGLACWRILRENADLFKIMPGSSNNHQAWPGGYWDHVQEVMNVAMVFYQAMNSLRTLPFSLSDALLVLFLHDIEKPWKYQINSKTKVIRHLRDKEAQHEFRLNKLREYGIKLTQEQKNGIKYVEGESRDYSNGARVMGPLAAFCHLCDVVSSRIWFDHPMFADEWTNIGRANARA